jgi:hypothetical protein
MEIFPPILRTAAIVGGHRLCVFSGVGGEFLAKITKILVKMTKKEGIIPNMKDIIYKLAKKRETLLTPYCNGVKIITKCSCTC